MKEVNLVDLSLQTVPVESPPQTAGTVESTELFHSQTTDEAEKTEDKKKTQADQKNTEKAALARREVK